MGLFSMEGFNKWVGLGKLMPGMEDGSDPESGWRKLRDKIVDCFWDLMEQAERDRDSGYPQMKKLLITIFAATVVLLLLAKFIRVTFFSYRQYIKAPILTIDLHAHDPSFIRSPAVTTATFYRGGAPLALIRRRLIQIIKKNPWLTARLVYENGKYTLKYSGNWDSDSVVDHLEIRDDRSLVLELDYMSMMRKVSRYIVGNGSSALNKNIPLFKISVVQNPSGFTFIMSMSHMLGDGMTFYNIYGMFNGDISAVRPLIARREQKYCEEGEKLSKMFSYIISVPFIIRVVLFMFFEPKISNRQVYKVDIDWVNAQKKLNKEPMPSSGKKNKSKGGSVNNDSFVSTNDVMVSWWASCARFDYCIMAVNYRERLSRLSSDHAGNYSSATVLYPEDYKTPAGVRRVVSNLLTDSEVPPTIQQTMKYNCGLATNWSTFYSEVEFEHCTLLRHLPVFQEGRQRLRSGFVLFCPKKGELAALIGSSDFEIASRLHSGKDNGPCRELLMNFKSV